jgi:ABC-type nitrate/sulfonate/bicarbonate transport system ATPase subunit
MTVNSADAQAGAHPIGSGSHHEPLVGESSAAAGADAYVVRNVGVTLRTARGPLEILRDVNLRVPQGEILGIVGRSGTGKTTLLRVLGGLLRPTTGTASVDGVEITGPPEQVVTVFQDYASALLPWRSLERNVALPLERKLGRAERRDRVSEALAMVGLESRAKDYPWRLSGGMQQRVQIARALALRPRVLLMDEPFGALDAMTKATLQDQLLTVQRETGATVIFITHDIEEAIYLSDRVALIAGAPGHIPVEIPTQLGRPRDQIETRELPRYLEVRHELHAALAAEHGK